ncbi:MAG TPA: metallophosphoesterase [Bryobacteraceae bacterium]|nr:metallophosphoesterase [Bryobacteraceae bacterium]
MRRLVFNPWSIAAVGFLAMAQLPAHKGIQAAAAEKPAAGITLPLKTGSVRFAVIGDSGSGDAAETQVALQMEKTRRLSNFDFVLMVGDNLYGGSSPGDYEQRFGKPFKPLLDRGVKFYAALGNHDNTNETGYAPFNMGGNRYYSFRKADVQFFVLDSNYLDGPQIDWLKGELEKSTAAWKIAYLHHPLYSSGKRHGSDMDLRTVLEPILKNYGVQVVLQGHDHVYERVKAQGGIVYFVVGNSGQLRSGGLGMNGIKEAGFDTDRCFMVVEISGDELYFQTISRAGETVDSGAIKRTAGGIASAP